MSRCWCIVTLFCVTCSAWGETPGTCSCGGGTVGRAELRESRPYASTPEDLRPFSNFTTPYFEHYTKLVEYNGPARDVPVPNMKDIHEVRIGFLGPVADHPDQALGKAMLNGVVLAIEEANAAGGYCGKPFRLMVHNDQATWGASSNEVVKMVYDDQVWAIFGSISGDSTHIALRVALKAEVPIVNSAATDPTIPETVIPWYLTVIQDDRVQGYTLARRIYDDLGVKRVGILRINDRYGRFGVGKFRDASRRLGHPVVIEQKYMYGETDFSRQLRVLQDSNIDGVVLWGDAGAAGMILKQMRAAGMAQRVFGSFRVLGDDLFRNAGAAAEGLEFVYPYDASRGDDSRWTTFSQRFGARFDSKPDAFSSLGYDGMKILLDAICRAGLNRGAIREALTGLERYRGVTGDMTFDPNCKNIATMYLGVVRGGQVQFRPYPMAKPYARIGDTPVRYTGPPLPDVPPGKRSIAVFGPKADLITGSVRGYQVIGIDSEKAWSQSTGELVRLLYDPHVIGLIATDRDASHLALQLANKIQLPVLAISDDTSLTAVNVPWVFRLRAGTLPLEAAQYLIRAATGAAPNREAVRRVLASGTVFTERGEPLSSGPGPRNN